MCSRPRAAARPAMTDCAFLLRDASTGGWLSFERPREVLVARRPSEVPELLVRLDESLARGRWVAGFLGYEAAAGLDPAFAVRPDGLIPCAVFGVFDGPAPGSAPPMPAPGSPVPVTNLRASISAPEHHDALNAVREAIREGDTYQVNLTYRFHGRLTRDPEQLFAHLVAGQAATYAAWGTFGRFAVACASPELHFARTGDRVTSRPMKGTAARRPDPAQDREALAALVASPKERAENLMIVDMVRNDLSRVAEPDSVRVPELFTAEAYPTVWQLTSLVEGRSTAPLSALIRALFPAASITGAPKASTMGLIARLEPTPRGIYTGSIGFAAPDGSCQFNVAIRTAFVDRVMRRFVYGVGGGVVWDSLTKREWAESRAKARILRRPAPRFDLLETLRWDPSGGYALLEAHVGRLGASAAELGFPPPTAALGALQRASAGFGPDTMRVRLTWSSAGAADVRAEPLVPTPAFDRPRLAIAPACIASADPLLRHKTTHRALYDAMRALCPDADDVVLWNERGEVTETTWSNLFVERNGVLLTPPVASGLLPGTLRGRLLAEGRAREHVLTPGDVLEARTLWLGNSVRGLYPAGPVTDARPPRSGTV